MTRDVLATELRGRVVVALGDAPFDWLLLALPENVAYVTGFRTLADTMRRDPTTVAALHASGELLLTGSAADAGPVLHDAVVDDDRYIPYGTFFYESTAAHPAARAADVHASLGEALASMLERRGPDPSIGADAPAAFLLGGRSTVDAARWMLDIRARKVEREIERLERAALLTEAAIESSLELLMHDATECEVARHVAGHLAAGGASPRFVVVTAGERSALSDVLATDRPIRPGDLVRYDIGSVLDGYWADLGRTFVIGPPTELQRRRYDAILAGEQAQLDAARPGVTAHELFERAVRTVEANGLVPYRRHHCGHAIGSQVYEHPIIGPGQHDELQEGMTFCFETPFYDLGWGGMMVEDTVVVTDDGCRALNRSDRSLRSL